MPKLNIKKILIVVIIFLLLAYAGIVYLNRVVLPTKAKAFIVNALKDYTGKDVTLESVKINVFKGIVLKNLVISDNKKEIISVNEGTCLFFFIPIITKNVIIPSITLKKPIIYLERRADNTLNLQELFPKKDVVVDSPKKKSGLNIIIHTINIVEGVVNFEDNALTPPFKKTIGDINLKLYLSLPASVRFNFKCSVLGKNPVGLISNGEYNFLAKELSSKSSISGLFIKDFSAYYNNSTVNILDGKIDSSFELKFKDDTVSSDGQLQVSKLSFTKELFYGRIDSALSFQLKYGLKSKEFKCSGQADIKDGILTGLITAAKMEGIKALVRFDNSGLVSDKISLRLSGLPIEGSFSLKDFNNPLINVKIPGLDLNSAQQFIAKELDLKFPLAITGSGDLNISFLNKDPVLDSVRLDGFLDLKNTTINLDNFIFPLDNINGRIHFTLKQADWDNLSFKFLDKPYSTKGVLTDFSKPRIDFGLASDELILDSALAIDGKTINIAKFQGKYLSSDFTASGSISTANPESLDTNLSGNINLNLEDLKKQFKGIEKTFDEIKPIGIMNSKFSLEGDVKKIKDCVLDLTVNSPDVSLYGLKLHDFVLTSRQEREVFNITDMHFSFYDGLVNASGAMNLAVEHLPYWLALAADNVMLEKLKLDTPLKDKDIAGIIQAQAKFNGSSNDISKLSGAGKILIKDGRLWELNLFQGLGKLIYSKEFEKIIFKEGSCGFSLQDKYISSDNLALKSDILDLSGKVKIGFDNSVEASVDIRPLGEAMPLNNNFQDLARAILGNVDSIGTIKINGTLKEPKYKFIPFGVNVINGLKDSLIGTIFGK